MYEVLSYDICDKLSYVPFSMVQTLFKKGLPMGFDYNDSTVVLAAVLLGRELGERHTEPTELRNNGSFVALTIIAPGMSNYCELAIGG